MQHIIQKVLAEAGYRQISCNVPSISLHIMDTDTESTPVIVTIDETQGLILSLEQFRHISLQLRNFLKKQELYHCVFMYLLITEDDSSSDRLFPEFKNFWRIVPSQGLVMAYEDADPLFTPLQQMLETHITPEASVPAQGAYPEGETKMLPLVTIALVAINVIIFIYSNLLSGNSREIIDWGALGYTYITEYHEWYRFITSMFLHLDFNHLFNNMLVLYFIGVYLENYLGHGKYLLLYFSTGLLAGCTSIVYNIMISDPTSSVGASGAIFGVMGGLVVSIFQTHRQKRELDLRRVLFMVFLSLYGGFTSQGVDNSAHVGGFISGVLAGILLTLHRTEKGIRIHD